MNAPCSYKITVFTSDIPGAGTTSRVFISVIGSNGVTRPVAMPGTFDRSTKVVNTIVDCTVGQVRKIEIGHDGSGARSKWHLAYVEVTVLTGMFRGTTTFVYDGWIKPRTRGEPAIIRIRALDMSRRNVYKVIVRTEDGSDTGTRNRVSIRMKGYNGEVTDELDLRADGRRLFQPGQTDVFFVDTGPRCVGKVETIDVGFIETPGIPLYPDNWHLKSATVIYMNTGESTEFEFQSVISHRGESKLAKLSRFMSRKGLQALGASFRNRDATPPTRIKTAVLGQSDTGNKHNYRVAVCTSDIRNAGTDSRVFCTIYGTNGNTATTYLPGEFERNTRVETLFTDVDVGLMHTIRIGHDGSGVNESWHLAYVIVEDLSAVQDTLAGPKQGISKVFFYNNWIKRSRAGEPVEIEIRALAKDRNVYKVTVRTSNIPGAGTNKTVSLKLMGRKAGISPEYELAADRNKFDQGAVDVFFLDLSSVRLGRVEGIDIGYLDTVTEDQKLNYEESGVVDWHLNSVSVEHMNSGRKYDFIYNDWLLNLQAKGAGEGPKLANPLAGKKLGIDKLASRRQQGSLESYQLQRGARVAEEPGELEGVAEGEEAPPEPPVVEIKYRVAFVTAADPGSDTDGGVKFRLVGDVGSTDEITLKGPFYSGTSRDMAFRTRDLGSIKLIEVEHLPTGRSNAWRLTHVVILNETTHTRRAFVYGAWLGQGGVLRASLAPLADNNRMYRVTVRTSDRPDASTAHVISVRVKDAGGRMTPEMDLLSDRRVLQAGQADTFLVSAGPLVLRDISACDIGFGRDVTESPDPDLRTGSQSPRGRPEAEVWWVDWVQIEDIHSGEEVTFHFQRWIQAGRRPRTGFMTAEECEEALRAEGHATTFRSSPPRYNQLRGASNRSLMSDAAVGPMTVDTGIGTDPDPDDVPLIDSKPNERGASRRETPDRESSAGIAAAAAAAAADAAREAALEGEDDVEAVDQFMADPLAGRSKPFTLSFPVIFSDPAAASGSITSPGRILAVGARTRSSRSLRSALDADSGSTNMNPMADDEFHTVYNNLDESKMNDDEKMEAMLLMESTLSPGPSKPMARSGFEEPGRRDSFSSEGPRITLGDPSGDPAAAGPSREVVLPSPALELRPSVGSSAARDSKASEYAAPPLTSRGLRPAAVHETMVTGRLGGDSDDEEDDDRSAVTSGTYTSGRNAVGLSFQVTLPLSKPNEDSGPDLAAAAAAVAARVSASGAAGGTNSKASPEPLPLSQHQLQSAGVSSEDRSRSIRSHELANLSGNLEERVTQANLDLAFRGRLSNSGGRAARPSASPPPASPGTGVSPRTVSTPPKTLSLSLMMPLSRQGSGTGAPLSRQGSGNGGAAPLSRQGSGNLQLNLSRQNSGTGLPLSRQGSGGIPGVTTPRTPHTPTSPKSPSGKSANLGLALTLPISRQGSGTGQAPLREAAAQGSTTPAASPPSNTSARNLSLSLAIPPARSPTGPSPSSAALPSATRGIHTPPSGPKAPGASLVISPMRPPLTAPPAAATTPAAAASASGAASTDSSGAALGDKDRKTVSLSLALPAAPASLPTSTAASRISGSGVSPGPSPAAPSPAGDRPAGGSSSGLAPSPSGNANILLSIERGLSGPLNFAPPQKKAPLRPRTPSPDRPASSSAASMVKGAVGAVVGAMVGLGVASLATSSIRGHSSTPPPPLSTPATPPRSDGKDDPNQGRDSKSPMPTHNQSQSQSPPVPPSKSPGPSLSQSPVPKASLSPAPGLPPKQAQAASNSPTPPPPSAASLAAAALAALGPAPSPTATSPGPGDSAKKDRKPLRPTSAATTDTPSKSGNGQDPSHAQTPPRQPLLATPSRTSDRGAGAASRISDRGTPGAASRISDRGGGTPGPSAASRLSDRGLTPPSASRTSDRGAPLTASPGPPGSGAKAGSTSGKKAPSPAPFVYKV